MTRIGVLGFGGYVPERIMTNDEWSEYVDTSDDWIAARTGIRERRIAAPEQSTVDLSAEAARLAITDAGLTVDDIDEIVLATDTPEVYTPDTAAHLQDRLGIGSVPAYDLGGSGCAGFVLALDVARARIHQSPRRVLVVGVELLTRLMNWYDRTTCVLFGDAAGAVVMGPSDTAPEIIAADAGTDGSQAGILGLETGGTRRPFTRAEAEVDGHYDVVMKGREVFREAVHHMTASSRRVLELAGKTLDDVNLVIPHQANARIVEAIRSRLGIDEETVYVNLDRFGNTGSASVPLALWEARGAGMIAPGDLVLLTAFGAGFHWASALVQF